MGAVDTRDIPTLPDLLELESATGGGRAHFRGVILVWGLLTLLLTAVVVGGYLFCGVVFGHRRPDLPELALVAAGAITAIGFILGRWTSLLDYEWQTDIRGLTIRSVMREKLYLWSDLEKVRDKGSSLAGVHFRLQFGRRSVSITLGQAPDGMLAASVWQHARRVGKTANAPLPTILRTLWAQLPEDVPQEMDWYNPDPPAWKMALLGGIGLVAALVFLAYMILKSDNRIGGHLGSLVHIFMGGLGAGYAAFHARLNTARSFKMRIDHFETHTALRQISLPWSEVRTIRISPDSLTLRTATRGTVVVPYAMDSQETLRLAFGILRHLRNRENPLRIIIPEPLNRALPGCAVQSARIDLPESVEMRMPTRTLIILLASVLVIGVLTTFMLDVIGPLGKYRWAMVLASLYIALSLLILMSHSVRADAEGITRRHLWMKRRISWREVAAYIVRPMAVSKAFATPHMHAATMRRELRDASGQLLMAVPMLGTPSQQEAFTAFLDAKLADVRRDEGTQPKR